MYKVKDSSTGKVRLVRGELSVALNDTTPQEVLEQFYKSPVGKRHIIKIRNNGKGSNK